MLGIDLDDPAPLQATPEFSGTIDLVRLDEDRGVPGDVLDMRGQSVTAEECHHAQGLFIPFAGPRPGCRRLGHRELEVPVRAGARTDGIGPYALAG